MGDNEVDYLTPRHLDDSHVNYHNMMMMTCTCRGGQRSSSACSASPMWLSVTGAGGKRQRAAGDRKKNWHSTLLNRSPDVPCCAMLSYAIPCYIPWHCAVQ